MYYSNNHSDSHRPYCISMKCRSLYLLALYHNDTVASLISCHPYLHNTADIDGQLATQCDLCNIVAGRLAVGKYLKWHTIWSLKMLHPNIYLLFMYTYSKWILHSRYLENYKLVRSYLLMAIPNISAIFFKMLPFHCGDGRSTIVFVELM